MKKILALLISVCILFSSISTASALDVELPKNLEDFTADVSELINEYDEMHSDENAVFFTADEDVNDNTSGTNRLIVKSDKKIDRLNSVNCVSGYKDLYILQFENAVDCEEALEYYSSLSCVQYVQEDGILTETAIEETENVFTEAAIDISSQYQSDLFGYTNAKASMGSAKVTIAVIDTGVANDHEYLKGRVNPTGFDSVYNESCYDKRGHGTHVAGIIVANTNSNVKINPYKVIGDDGTGTDMQLYLGIQAAIEDGVDIINLSLTRKGDSEVVHEAVTDAYNAGITVVAAAGNDNANLNETFYTPACFDEVICVVSIDTNKKRASTSNWRYNDTLSAPGVDILSSYIDNTYKIMSGTSMATPFISCCVAYLLATGKYYSPESVYNTLYDNSKQGATANIHYVVPGTLINCSNTCVTPEFSYLSGEFAGYLDVEITCDTPGATIMYRTSDMNSKTYYEYTGPIRIEKTATFSAYAFCKNYKSSASATATYTKIDIDTSVFEVDENGALIGYSGTEAVVEIPDYTNGKCVTSVVSSAFAGNLSVSSVSFGKYMTTIGEGAFKGCTALTSVSASGCTDVEAEAFSGCTSLKNVSMTNVVSVNEKAFYGCSSLTKLTLSKLTTLGERAFEKSGLTTFSASRLVSIGDYAFSGTFVNSAAFSAVTNIGANAYENCKNLTTVTFSKAKQIGADCFAGCDNLKSAAFNSLTVIPENLFKNCTFLTSADFSAATEVKSYAFYGCSALTTVELSKITSVGDYAFYGCNITSFDFSNVTSIGDYAFCGNGIDNINLPKVTEIGECAFYNCLAVETIELPASTTFDTADFIGVPNVETLVVPKVTEFAFNGGAFAENFPKLKAFYNKNGIQYIPDNFLSGCSALETIEFHVYVYEIGANAFKGTALKEVVFDEVSKFGDDCFANIPTLEKVDLRRPNYIDFSIFSGSENIQKLYLSNLIELPDDFRCAVLFPDIRSINLKQVENIPAYAFKDCVNLSGYSGYAYTIGDEAFMNTGITNVDCSWATTIGQGAFKDCKNLSVVKLPYLKAIDLSIFENSEPYITELDLNGIVAVSEEEADNFNFSEFISLKSINLDSLTVLPARTFKDCPALEAVRLDNCTKVCEEAFAYCTSLISVNLNKVTTIEKNAFKYCASLQTFEANSVTSFDFTTFDGCSNLKSLSFNSLTEIPVGEDGKLNIKSLENLESFSADKLTSVPDNFFKNCEKLTTVSFSSATKVGNYAFYNTALTSYDFTNIRTIGAYAFYNTDISSISSNSTSVVTDVSEFAFAECDSLTSVYLPKARNVGEGAFYGCDALTSISLPLVQSLPVSAISACQSMTNIEIPLITELPVEADGTTYVSDKPELISFTAEYVTVIPEEYFINNPLLQDAIMYYVEEVGDRAFMNTDLRSLPTDGLVSVGEYAFYGTEISSVDTYCIETIGDYAFANCAYLSVAYIYNDEFLCEGTGEIKLGKGVFENDTALVRAYLMFKKAELPDYFFKNCADLKWVLIDDVRNPSSEDYADIKSVGEEAFYGCTAMSFEKLKLIDIEYIGKNAFVGLKTASSENVSLPNLMFADEGAFGNLNCYSLALENAEVIKDIPDCSYVIIGSDIKEFSCDSTDTIICAYEDSVVDKFCTVNGLNFKKYDGKENIFYDVDSVLTGYDYYLYFDAIGFNCTYEWYACNNPDRSDAVLLETSLIASQVIEPIKLFVDDYEENKYTYFYCVATSTENGNVLKIQSQLCKNIFATLKDVDDTLIDYIEEVIFTNSLYNINTLDNIVTIDGDIRVTPSYSTDNEVCYGSGTLVEILNGDDVALSQVIVVFGDINGDGVVDALDVSRIEKESNGNTSEFSEYALEAAADIDRSGRIDALDYQAAVNKALAS